MFVQLTTFSVPVWDCAFHAEDAGAGYTPQLHLKAPQPPWSVTENSLTKKPTFLGVRLRCFSHRFPWAAEVGLTGHCSLVGCSHSCPPDWHFHCFPCAGSHLPPLCDLRDSPVSKIPNPSNKAKTCVGILLIWLVQRHCWWPAEHPMKHGEGMGRGAGHSKAVVTLTYLPARLASKLQNCASSKDGQDKWYLSKIVIF